MRQFAARTADWFAFALLIILSVASPMVFGGVFLREFAWLTALTAVAVGLCLVIRAGRGSSRLFLLSGAVVSLLIWQMISGGSVEKPTTELRLATFLLPVGLLWVTSRIVCTPKRIQLVLWSLVAVAIAMTLFGIAQRLSWTGELYWSIPIREGEPFGAFVNRNNAGAFLCVGLAASLALSCRGLLDDDIDQETVIAAAASCLVFAGVVSTASRSAVLAALVGGIALAARLLQLRVGGVAFAAISLATTMSGLLVAAVLGQSQRAVDRFAALTLASSSNGRLDHWRDVLQGILERPFLGWGAGTYEVAHRPFLSMDDGKVFEHADNLWFELTFELGFVGAAIFAAGCLVAFWTAWRRSRASNDTTDRLAALAVVFLVPALAAQEFFDFALLLAGVSAPAAVLVGLSLPRRHFRPAVSRQVLSIAFGATLLIGLGWASRTTAQATAVENVTGLLPRKWGVNQPPPAVAESLIQELEVALGRRPHDPDGLEAFASLQIHRFRQQCFKATKDYYPAAVAWERTALAALHREWVARGRNDSGYIANLQNEPLVAAHLSPALDAADRLATDAPLRARAVLWRSELGFLDDRDLIAIDELIANEHLLAGWAAGNLEAGAIAANVRDLPAAIDFWKRAAALTERYDARLSIAATGCLTVDEIVGIILPQRPDRLLRFAAAVRGGPSDPLRTAAINRAEELAASVADAAKRLAIEAEIAELRGDKQSAVRLLQKAADGSPRRLPYWLQIARLSLDLGDTREAIRCLRIAATLAPEDPAVRTLQERANRSARDQGLVP